jgi:hypothetical protein
MTTDLYTKAVLTVIALALSSIALQHAIPSAFAQSGIQKVIICESENSCATLDGIALRVSLRR